VGGWAERSNVQTFNVTTLRFGGEWELKTQN
jgi:hypothetical protein